MTWVRATPQFLARAAERQPWLFVAASIVFWTLLFPLALGWLALWLIDHHRALDKSPAARRDRRVTRLLAWYPAQWRARYGEEMAALLHDTIAERADGLQLSVDVAKAGLAARAAPPARRHALAATCLSLCWIPLVPQALVPAIIKLTGTPARSWFLALYLPDACQWPLIAAMFSIGLLVLSAGTRLAGMRLTPRRN